MKAKRSEHLVYDRWPGNKAARIGGHTKDQESNAKGKAPYSVIAYDMLEIVTDSKHNTPWGIMDFTDQIISGTNHLWLECSVEDSDDYKSGVFHES